MHVPTPAPKVEAATAEAVKPKAAPLAEQPVASSATNAEAVSASFVCAEPPPNPNASLTTDADKDDDNDAKKYDDGTKPTVEALRATGKIVFEGYAGVIIGAVHKSLCEKSFQCFYDERCFLSYGEVKRYIVIMKDSHVIFVYGDADMSSPMYTIPITELDCLHEDPNNPSFYSHTISPEANPGLLGEPFSNNKSKGSLDTILLLDGKGKIAFQLAFDRSEEGESVLDTFMKAVVQASSSSKGKEVKKK